MPKISCIMPVYNTAKYLDECIWSILNQTFTDFEFIISDDGSTDGSKEIIKKYAEKDNRIIFLDNPKNRGIVANLNDCLDKAQGEFIAIMESDDVSMPERFEIELNEFENDNDLMLVGTQGYFIDKNSNIIGNYKTSINSNIINLTFFTPGIIFKKLLIDKLEIFSGGYVWDMKLYYDIFFSNLKTKVINNNLVKKRMFELSTLNSNFLKIHKILFNLRFNTIKKFNLEKKYIYYSLLDLFINYIIYFSKKIKIYNILSPIWRKYILKIK